jgi:ParB family chromosome partitioning protein
MELLYLDPSTLEPDPQGIREETGDIDGLAATIAEYGLLQPLAVVPIATGRYRVVYGNRRRAAAVKLGLERVPCILLDANDSDQLIQQVTENIQRQDLNDFEKAQAFARLRQQIANEGKNLNEGELDERTGQLVGLAPRTIRRYLGLLELAPEVQELLRSGDLTVTQAQHLRRIASPRTQLELARAAVDEGMPASEISRLSSYFAANPDLTLDAALSALQQGMELRRDIVGQPDQIPGGGPLGRTNPAAMSLDGDDNDIWDEDEESADDSAYLSVEEETIENQPKNKARVFRIRSLDQMVDESDRLSRAYAEGDLAKWIAKDEGAPMKVRLLYKQLRKLSSVLRDLAQQQGWQVEDEDEE